MIGFRHFLDEESRNGQPASLQLPKIDLGVIKPTEVVLMSSPAKTIDSMPKNKLLVGRAQEIDLMSAIKNDTVSYLNYCLQLTISNWWRQFNELFEWHLIKRILKVTK